jgi:hypothetical protein
LEGLPEIAKVPIDASGSMIQPDMFLPLGFSGYKGAEFLLTLIPI